jgi:hypothetical protein
MCALSRGAFDQRFDLGLAQHPVAHQRLGKAADRWPMLIDQCSGLFERAIEEIEKLPGAFALQRKCWPSTTGSPQRRNCSLSRKLQAFSLSSYQPPPSSHALSCSLCDR